MFKRDAYSQINKLLQTFPVVAVTGPRQSGKTTLLKEKFPKYRYFNLEDPDIHNIIQEDKGGFIKSINEPVILDEVQKIPELLSYIQVIVDEEKIMGKFIISGSENLLLSQKINQTLAGRAAYLNLFPLTINELYNRKFSSFRDLLLHGFYPAIYDRNIDPVSYYNQYIATYVERDVKQISNIHNLSLFRKFLGLLAGRVGSVVNYTSLSNDVGVDIKTIENWIAILEATFIIFRLQPFHTNFGKRHIKSPKIYFTDTGVLCRLLGISSEVELQTHSLVGSIFENLVIADIYKNKSHRNETFEMFFYRNSNGNEVDLLKVEGEEISLFEIKSSSTWTKSFIKGIDAFCNVSKDSHYRIKEKIIVYNGESSTLHDYVIKNYMDFSSSDIFN